MSWIQDLKVLLLLFLSESLKGREVRSKLRVFEFGVVVGVFEVTQVVTVAVVLQLLVMSVLIFSTGSLSAYFSNWCLCRVEWLFQTDWEFFLLYFNAILELLMIIHQLLHLSAFLSYYQRRWAYYNRVSRMRFEVINPIASTSSVKRVIVSHSLLIR